QRDRDRVRLRVDGEEASGRRRLGAEHECGEDCGEHAWRIAERTTKGKSRLLPVYVRPPPARIALGAGGGGRLGGDGRVALARDRRDAERGERGHGEDGRRGRRARGESRGGDR